MATRMWDVCGIRPATVTIKRIFPGEGQRIEHLCEIHAAEARGGRSPFGGSPLGGGSLFDEFFGRFFGDEEPLGARGGGTAAPRRQSRWT